MHGKRETGKKKTKAATNEPETISHPLSSFLSLSLSQALSYSMSFSVLLLSHESVEKALNQAQADMTNRKEKTHDFFRKGKHSIVDFVSFVDSRFERDM